VESGRALKKRTAVLSVIVTAALTASKLVVGILSGSLSILAEALHSFLDFIAASVAYTSVRKSAEPADAGHHYGHTKFEALGAFIEGILIFLPYLLVLIYAVKNFGAVKINEEFLGWGIALMAVSVVANLAVGLRLSGVGAQTNSLALKGDALHLMSDAATSIAVLLALLLVKVTGVSYYDPAITILVSVYIIVLAFILMFRSGQQLADAAPREESEIRKEVEEILSGFPGFIFEAHNFRCRGQRPDYFIDFHLVCCRYLTLEETHDYCDRIEDAIRGKFPGSDITIHTEPCDEHESCPGPEGRKECKLGHAKTRT